MATSNSCPMCGTNVPQDASACPKCGDQQWLNGVPPHSGPGIASFILAVLGAITLFGSFGFMVYLTVQHRGRMPPFNIVVFTSLFIYGSIGLLIIAAILGLVGVLLPDRKKRYAILGLFFSAVAAVLYAVIFKGLR